MQPNPQDDGASAARRTLGARASAAANPPQQGSRRATFAPNGIGFQQCENYGLAYADANFRDSHRFYGMPHQHRRSVWLCNGLVVRSAGAGGATAAGSVGQDGCAEVLHG